MDTKIEQLAEIIKDSENIVFFGGAGVSTESKIPDFRSETGLYKCKNEYGRSPEEIISASFFRAHTDIFYDYYKKNMIYADAQPNDAHLALAKLEQMGKLKAVVTQNIDGLHQRAGSKNVFELHGTIEKNRCQKCGESYVLAYILNEGNCDHGIPKCKLCGGTVKPEVVLYEEPLDGDVMDGAIRAIMRADTLIVGGTSLVVYPAAGMIRYFRGENLVLINKSSTQYDRYAHLVINDGIGKVFREVMRIVEE